MQNTNSPTLLGQESIPELDSLEALVLLIEGHTGVRKLEIVIKARLYPTCSDIGLRLGLLAMNLLGLLMDLLALLVDMLSLLMNWLALLMSLLALLMNVLSLLMDLLLKLRIGDLAVWHVLGSTLR